MAKSIGIHMDEESACGFEHYMNDRLAETICRKLHDPAECLHGRKIPLGRELRKR